MIAAITGKTAFGALTVPSDLTRPDEARSSESTTRRKPKIPCALDYAPRAPFIGGALQIVSAIHLPMPPAPKMNVTL
jgi:hypothetical protein